MYVVRVDVKNNTVVLGEAGEEYSAGLVASDLNWIAIDKPVNAMTVGAKVRYSAQEARATLYVLEDGKVRVDFLTPQRAITPGQSVVFYDGDIVLGGGVIEKQINEKDKN
jgi:tRNA-specific 2-thiouridylase